MDIYSLFWFLIVIVDVVGVALGVFAYTYAFRYNLHIFQLNGYKDGEHINRMKKNLLAEQWPLLVTLCLGVLHLFILKGVTTVIILIMFIITGLKYRAKNRRNTKKKLVYTARVKRLMATNIIISVLPVAFIRISDIYVNIGIIGIVVGLQFIMVVISNVINKPIEKSVTSYYINDAKKMLRNSPDLKIIGVTGSYGKTSVKFYLQTLLKEKYNVLVTPESFNTPMGVVRTIREHLKSTDEIFICEMGARHVGDIKEICDMVHPHHGIITSVGPQHLETFFNMDNIKNTKFELADALPEDGMLFLNGDNDFIQEKAVEYKNKVFYYSEKDGSGYKASDLKLTQLGTEFTVTAPDGESERFQMKLIGAHNVINVVGAIAVAHKLGVSLADLKIPVRRILPVEHRMQMREHGLVTIVDDAYNSNPVGSKAAVETLKMFEGERILITPGMVELGDKEEEYNYKFGTYAAQCCDYILLVGKKRTEPIKNGIMSMNFPEDRCKAFDKLEEALAFAYGINSDKHKYILLENDLPDNY